MNASDKTNSGRKSSAFQMQYGRGPKKTRFVCEACGAGWDYKRDWKKCCKGKEES